MKAKSVFKIKILCNAPKDADEERAKNRIVHIHLQRSKSRRPHNSRSEYVRLRQLNFPPLLSGGYNFNFSISFISLNMCKDLIQSERPLQSLKRTLRREVTHQEMCKSMRI